MTTTRPTSPTPGEIWPPENEPATERFRWNAGLQCWDSLAVPAPAAPLPDASPAPPEPEPQPGPSPYDLLYLGLIGSTIYPTYLAEAMQSQGNAMPVAMSVLMNALDNARFGTPIVPAMQAALELILQVRVWAPAELAELGGILAAAGLAETFPLPEEP